MTYEVLERRSGGENTCQLIGVKTRNSQQSAPPPYDKELKVVLNCKGNHIRHLIETSRTYSRNVNTILLVIQFPGTTRKKKVVGLERGPLSLVSTTVELLHRKVAAPV
jgi:hypothetical protein